MQCWRTPKSFSNGNDYLQSDDTLKDKYQEGNLIQFYNICFLAVSKFEAIFLCIYFSFWYNMPVKIIFKSKVCQLQLSSKFIWWAFEVHPNNWLLKLETTVQQNFKNKKAVLSYPLILSSKTLNFFCYDWNFKWLVLNKYDFLCLEYMCTLKLFIVCPNLLFAKQSGSTDIFLLLNSHGLAL